jgi:hypothetical protein
MGFLLYRVCRQDDVIESHATPSLDEVKQAVADSPDQGLSLGMFTQNRPPWHGINISISVTGKPACPTIRQQKAGVLI